MPPHLIAHVDADCFYVSAERVRSPELRGLPVGVLGNQGACVIAKSYEAKADGVKTGMPIWDAGKLSPNAVYVKRDFEWYETLSRRMLACVREVSQTVEYYSIDEFFFDASYLQTAYGGSPLDAATGLQRRMLEKTGVPVSIGIAPTRTLAKLASDANKPYGCEAITSSGQITTRLEGMPVQEVTGIAGRSARKLAAHGITTCDQFVAADRRLIRELLTIKGEELWYELQGIAVQEILTSRPMHKHVARGGSLGRGAGSRLKLEAWLARNLERLVETLQSYKYVCRTLSLDLTYRDQRGCHAQTTLTVSTNVTEVLRPAANDLFERCYLPGAVGSYMHVIAGGLETQGTEQQSLFAPRRPQLDAIKDLVNKRCGRFAVRSGSTLPLTDVYSDPSQQHDICDVAGKTCF